MKQAQVNPKYADRVGYEEWADYEPYVGDMSKAVLWEEHLNKSDYLHPDEMRELQDLIDMQNL